MKNGKKQQLTVTLHINGKQVETLTEEQREKIAQRLSEVMSLYYSNQQYEIMKIKERNTEY